jgi:hypothetical protein
MLKDYFPNCENDNLKHFKDHLLFGQLVKRKLYFFQLFLLDK